MIQIVISIGVVEPFGEPEDENARIRVFQLDQRVGPIVVVDGKEHVSNRILPFERRLADRCPLFGIVHWVEQMIAHDRVDLGFSEEAAPGFAQAEEQHRCRDGYCRVNAVLNTAEDGHNDANEEDGYFKWRNPPELIDGVGRSNQVSDCVDNDSGQGSIGNVPEHCRESIDGE